MVSFAPESTTLRLPFDLTGITRDWHDPEAGGCGPLFAEAILIRTLLLPREVPPAA